MHQGALVATVALLALSGCLAGASVDIGRAALPPTASIHTDPDLRLDLTDAVPDETGWIFGAHVYGFRALLERAFHHRFPDAASGASRGTATIVIHDARLEWRWLGHAGTELIVHYAAQVNRGGQSACMSRSVFTAAHRVHVGGVDEPSTVAAAVSEIYDQIVRDCFAVYAR